MDLWNNNVGRKYNKKSKNRQELAQLLKIALKNGELIISLDDLRKHMKSMSMRAIKTLWGPSSIHI